MENPIIKIENLTFSYPDTETPALQSISLEIARGSFTAILGHNGSGKSTLAKCFNGILTPAEGRVLVNGLDTADEDKLLDVRRCVGMVFQNPDNQIVASVVEDDVAFAPENLGVAPTEIRRRVDEALQCVGMYEFRLHAPHLLSGGQKQRVAIAGVLAMEPACIVLDEPTAMLDPIGRKEVLAAVERLRQERGMTVILITHHMSECVGADRLIVMSGGRIIDDGTPKEVFSRVEEMKAAGLTVPETVELLYGLRQAGYDLPLDALTVDECADAIASVLKSSGSSHPALPGKNQQETDKL